MTAAVDTVSGQLNKNAFTRSDVVDHYGTLGDLFEPERVILDRLLPCIKDGALLDLGIGAGRTTAHLLKISSNYTGLDYVPAFVDEARARFPGTDILVGDARDLSRFDDGSFDLVMFSFNGLDCVPHEGRPKVISEASRVLRKGGFFLFSSHNRDYEYFMTPPWRRKWEFNAQFLRFMLYSFCYRHKHWAMKKHEVVTDEYALVNDSDHRYSLMFYYIKPEVQAEQLAAAGFKDVEIYNTNGKRVSCDPSALSLHYVAAKA